MYQALFQTLKDTGERGRWSCCAHEALEEISIKNNSYQYVIPSFFDLFEKE
jgi:hypothetical protein